MNRFLLLFLGALFLSSCNTQVNDSFYDKMWVGTVRAQKQRVTIYMGLQNSFFRGTQAEVMVPEQGASEYEASKCVIIGDSIHVEFSGELTARYDGKLGKEGISGWWTQGGHRFALNLVNSGLTKYQLYAMKALALAKENAINRKSVDWKQIDQKVLEMAANATTLEELTPALLWILSSLGDKHGYVSINGQATYYKTSDPLSPAFVKAAYGNNKEIVSIQMEDSLAYLRIPTTSQDMKPGEYNRLLQKHICKLIDYGAKHWIVDLRLNEGGNMFEMLGGLNSLLGQGKIGAYVSADGKETEEWVIKSGNFYQGNELMTTVGSHCMLLTGAGKIAILAGPATSSSGEAIAIALRAKQNTKIFGGQTKGFTTGVSGYLVGKNVVFSLSTNYYSDGNGTIYKNGIAPDLYIEGGDNFKDVLKDKKVQAAIEWIKR